MRYKIVAMTDNANRSYSIEKEVLERIGGELTVSECKDPKEIIELCKEADGIITEYAPITAEVVENLRKCRVISRYGVGYDNVDVGACTRKGIYVANVPDYCAEEVSDHALALMMACARQIAYRDRMVRSCMWDIKGAPIHRIAGRVFAFLGFGTIARCLLRKIMGFGFGRILVYDPYVKAEVVRELGAEQVDLTTALREADFVSIHMPANDATQGLIGEKELGLMKPTAILINTSRGTIVDEKALADALKRKALGYAGLDVLEHEPIEPENALIGLDNCVLTDHVGWCSEEARAELKRKVAENVRDALEGRRPKYAVNDVEARYVE